MILTGPEIKQSVERGHIIIEPFALAQLNPNSYNYRLDAAVLITRDPHLEAHKSQHWQTVELPKAGLILEPGKLYLGSTVECIGSERYIPSLIGRSSMGRLGMFLQLSADLGNIGSAHCWTLEITVVQRLRVYPGMIVGQIAFWRPLGPVNFYSGNYHQFSGPTPSLYSNEIFEKSDR